MSAKRQRLLQLRQYDGAAKLVFERWISDVSYKNDIYEVTVKFTITSNRSEQVTESGEKLTTTARKACTKLIIGIRKRANITASEILNGLNLKSLRISQTILNTTGTNSN